MPGQARPGEKVVKEDEGYTSSSEEDFQYNPPASSSQKKNRDFHTANISNTINGLKPGTNYGNSTTSSSQRNVEDPTVESPNCDEDKEAVPWEDIAQIPYIRDRNLSWDHLKVPVPFRYNSEHVNLATKGIRLKDSSHSLFDSRERSNQFVDQFWRLNPESHLEISTGRSIHISDSVSSAVSSVKSCTAKPIVITLNQFIPQAFHLLSGRESQSFKLVSNSFLFHQTPWVILKGVSPQALYNYCTPLLRCGSIVKKLNQYAEMQYDTALMKKWGLQGCQVITSLFRFISDYLKLYNVVLMLNCKAIKTLSKLAVFTTPYRYQLELLEYLVDNTLSGNAVDFISSLNILLFSSINPCVIDIVRAMILTCSSAYLNYVSNWIFQGVLGPPKEFHIHKQHQSVHKDRRFWTKQFQQRTSVPIFLETSALLIFETGKAINLMQEIIAQDVFRCMPSLTLSAVGSDNIRLSLAFEDISQLRSDWTSKLESFLSSQNHISSEVSTCIQRLQQCCLNYDPETKDEVRLRRALQQETWEQNRQLQFENEKKKKADFRASLREQIEEAHLKKLQAIEISKVEDRKNEEYQLMRDRRDLKEEKRIRFKHFGDTDIPRLHPGSDVFSRLHAGPEIKPEMETAVDGSPVSSGLDNLIVDDVQLPHSISRSVEPHVDFVHKRADPDETLGSGDTHNLDDVNVIDEASKAALLSVSNLSEMELLTDDELSSVEEKFNPDKIKTIDPPPYSASVSFGNLYSGDPELIINFWRKINEDPSSESLSEEPQSASSLDPFLLNEFLSLSIIIPLEAQTAMVNATVLHYFVHEKKLFDNLAALNDYFCMQNGLFGYFLTDLLVKEVKRKRMESKADVLLRSGQLSMILAEAISSCSSNANEDESYFVQKLGFYIKDIENEEPEDTSSSRNNISTCSSASGGSGDSKTKKSAVHSDFQILDSVRLCYSVEWPLNIILTEEVLNHYEKMYTFLMQLNRAEALLKNTFLLLKVKHKSPQLQKLHEYHHRMMYFVKTVRNYVNVTVIHTSWTEFCSSFTEMDSLEKIYEFVVRHVKTVNTNCLLSKKSEGVMKLLKSQLAIIESFCSRLDRMALTTDLSKGIEIPSRQFNTLLKTARAVENLGKLFVEVASKISSKGYYPTIAYFVELYNFNGYFNVNS